MLLFHFIYREWNRWWKAFHSIHWGLSDTPKLLSAANNIETDYIVPFDEYDFESAFQSEFEYEVLAEKIPTSPTLFVDITAAKIDGLEFFEKKPFAYYLPLILVGLFIILMFAGILCGFTSSMKIQVTHAVVDEPDPQLHTDLNGKTDQDFDCTSSDDSEASEIYECEVNRLPGERCLHKSRERQELHVHVSLDITDHRWKASYYDINGLPMNDFEKIQLPMIREESTNGLEYYENQHGFQYVGDYGLSFTEESRELFEYPDSYETEKFDQDFASVDSGSVESYVTDSKIVGGESNIVAIDLASAAENKVDEVLHHNNPDTIEISPQSVDPPQDKFEAAEPEEGNGDTSAILKMVKHYKAESVSIEKLEGTDLEDQNSSGYSRFAILKDHVLKLTTIQEEVRTFMAAELDDGKNDDMDPLSLREQLNPQITQESSLRSECTKMYQNDESIDLENKDGIVLTKTSTPVDQGHVAGTDSTCSFLSMGLDLLSSYEFASENALEGLVKCAESASSSPGGISPLPISSPLVNQSNPPPSSAEGMPGKESILRVVYNEKKGYNDGKIESSSLQGNDPVVCPSNIPRPSRPTTRDTTVPITTVVGPKLDAQITKHFLISNEPKFEDYLDEVWGKDPEDIVFSYATLSQLSLADIQVLLDPFEGKETSENWKKRFDNLDFLICHVRLHLPEDSYEEFQELIKGKFDFIVEVARSTRSKLLVKLIVFLRDFILYANQGTVSDELFVIILDTLIPLSKSTQPVKYVRSMAIKALCTMVQSVSHRVFIQNFDKMFRDTFHSKRLKNHEKHTCLIMIKFFMLTSLHQTNSAIFIGMIVPLLLPYVDKLAIDALPEVRSEILSIYILILHHTECPRSLVLAYYEKLSPYMRSTAPKPSQETYEFLNED